MKNIYKLIKKLSICDPVTISDKLVKMSEEVGELCAAHMKKIGIKPLKKGETMKDVDANILEEGIDIIATVFDVMAIYGITYEEMVNAFPEKLGKWKRNIERKNKIINERKIINK